MKVNTNFGNIYKQIKKLNVYFKIDVFDVIGTEAVNHFQESFDNEGFTDKKLKKWKEVKRREAGSSWYGFKYGNKRNYSDAATKRPILSGDTQELRNSINYKAMRGRRMVEVFSDKVYAKIMNEGGSVRVFGKGKGTMPARQFMGSSEKLNNKIIKEIKRDVTKILK